MAFRSLEMEQITMNKSHKEMKLLGGTYGGKLRTCLVCFLGIRGTFANSRVWGNMGPVLYLDLGKNDSCSLFLSKGA